MAVEDELWSKLEAVLYDIYKHPRKSDRVRMWKSIKEFVENAEGKENART